MNYVLWKDETDGVVWNEAENPRKGLTTRQHGINVWWVMGKKETETDRWSAETWNEQIWKKILTNDE